MLSWDVGQWLEDAGASQGGVRELGSAETEEIAGVLGSIGAGVRREHGRSREAHGIAREPGGSWRIQGERGGNTGVRRKGN